MIESFSLPEFELSHMDEFIDSLLREERVCDVILPRIQKRYVLEEGNDLEPRISVLEEDDLDDESSSSSSEDEKEKEDSRRKRREEDKYGSGRHRSHFDDEEDRRMDRRERRRSRERERSRRERYDIRSKC